MLHILLAEDNAGDILLVREALREHSIIHELHVMRDGAQVLEAISQMGQPGHMPCPDLILLDLNLPKIDGPQLLQELRKHAHCAGIPVIVVTSSDAIRDRERVAKLGISKYFRKPSDFDAFLRLGAVVREVIDGGLASQTHPV